MNSLFKDRKTIFVALVVSVFMLAALAAIFAVPEKAQAAGATSFKLKCSADKHIRIYAGGKIAKNKARYKAGTVIKVKPKKRFAVKRVIVNGKNRGRLSAFKAAGGYIYKGSVVIKAESMKAPSNSTVTVKRNGMIDGVWGGSVTGIAGRKTSGKFTVAYGKSQVVNITPAAGYYLVKVKVDGKSAGRKRSVTIKGDGANHKVQVQFAKAVLKIKVDPGHAGKYNKGAVSGYWESIQVWKLSNYLTPYLNKIPGIKATKTKSNLYSDPLVYNRGRMAKGNDLFLSIHSNSSSSSSTDYPLTIVSYSKRHLYTVAQPLGVALSKAVRTTMKTRQAHQVWVKKQSDGRDWYGVIRGSSDVGVPGIIIEHSFHSNPTRAAWLMKNANLKKMASKETTVISSYYGLNANGTVVKPAVPAEFKVTAGKGKITVSRKNSPVTGVMVYRSTKATGGFKLIDTTSKLSYSNTELKAGKTYYYKIRAYRCNGKKIAYSAYTKVLGATVK